MSEVENQVVQDHVVPVLEDKHADEELATNLHTDAPAPEVQPPAPHHGILGLKKRTVVFGMLALFIIAGMAFFAHSSFHAKGLLDEDRLGTAAQPLLQNSQPITLDQPTASTPPARELRQGYSPAVESYEHFTARNSNHNRQVRFNSPKSRPVHFRVQAANAWRNARTVHHGAPAFRKGFVPVRRGAPRRHLIARPTVAGRPIVQRNRNRRVVFHRAFRAPLKRTLAVRRPVNVRPAYNRRISLRGARLHYHHAAQRRPVKI